jgi:hypothetical protein
MLFCHRSYTSIYSPEGHIHTPQDTIKVPDPEALDLDGVREEPALLASGTWRIDCTPACEQGIQKTVQYVGASEKAIPLTGDENREAERESARSQVEVAQMAKALTQLAKAGASAA